jgi:hypothetical protein
LIVVISALCCLTTSNSALAASPASAAGANTIIVQPKFGGQILGYDIDPNGTLGMLSEFVTLGGGNVLAATELFDQNTGRIVKVVAQTQTQDDFATQGIYGKLGLALYQHAGKNFFPLVKPLTSGKFNAQWTPAVKPGYLLWSISASNGTPNVAAYQYSGTDFLTYVFGSNISNNTFGPQISLAPIIDVDEFLQPQIALDSKTNQAVLADSLGCPEPICVTDIALVDLSSGAIDKFTDQLGIGTVDGLAVDSVNGIACTTSLIDQGVEFYNLASKTGFEVTIPNAGSSLQAGLSVTFDPVHHVFLVSQYSSTGDPNDPEPRVYVYDEQGNVRETVTGLQRLPVSPSLIAINPGSRTGFLPVIVEPQHQFLQLQSFRY